MEKFDIDQLYTRLLPRMEVLEQERIVLAGKLNKLKTISIGVTIILVIGIGFLMGLFWGLLLGAVLGIAFYTILYPKMRLELSFQKNNPYISISTLKELFEPPVKTPVTDKEDFKANFKYLVNTTGLLQQLTLVNT